MQEKNKQLFQTFENFQLQEEKKLWRWIIMANFLFLLSTFILVYISEKILELKILSWFHYWILVGGNIILFTLFYFALMKNFKVWAFKYFLAAYSPLLISSWIYFTDPQYTKVLFTIMIGFLTLLASVFYDIKTILVSAIVTTICFGLLFFHYSKIGTPIPLYEMYLLYMFLAMFLVISLGLARRIRSFLSELLKKTEQLEEAKSGLEIKVKARTKELKELTQSLEEQVSQRTRELQKRVGELESFQKLTVGREVKMVELKKETERLKKELEELKN